MNRFIVAILGAAACLMSACTNQNTNYDVLIIGGGASGTAAGVQSARMGVRTLIVEESEWLGGMLTSAGVSATDGNYKLRGGFWAEFRDSLETHYGGDSMLRTGWVSHVLFEPSVGDAILKNIVKAEKNLTVMYGARPIVYDKKNGLWRVRLACVGADGSVGSGDSKDNETEVTARVIIDGTELGDVAKALGVEYEIGMDSRAETFEDIAPEKKNDIIQDLTYVMILKDYGRDVTIDKPEGYDPAPFYCSCINDKCVNPRESERLWAKDMMITYGKLPNGKYMINWPLEGNDYYVDIVEMSPEERVEALKKAKNHSLSFLYFMQTELGFSNLSLADDEFPTADMLPMIPYHRESRRIDGVVRFTLNDICEPFSQESKLYRTSIGVGDYPVDHHHARYSGWSELPNLYFHPIPSYGLPLGVMIPRKVDGLVVAEKSISVTNIVNGTTRLQPVVLQIGQAAGALAALACKQDKEVRKVSVRDVQSAVLLSGGYLLPYLDLKSSDRHFGALQRIGTTGIIKGIGKNVGWENQMWFNADSVMTVGELASGLSEVYTDADMSAYVVMSGAEPVTPTNLAQLISTIEGRNAKNADKLSDVWTSLGLTDYDENRPLTRLECAVVIDAVCDPFNKIQVDVNGNYITSKKL